MASKPSAARDEVPEAKYPTSSDGNVFEQHWGLTMRLSDAGMRGRKTELIYLDHRFPPWLTEDAIPRSLEPIVRRSRWY
jgi:hypothetical protein